MAKVIEKIKNRIQEQKNKKETRKILSQELPKITKYFKDVLPEEYFLDMAQKNINSIKYVEPFSETFLGNYNYYKKEILINKDASEENKQVSIIHEMLHALTDRGEGSRGFKRKDKNNYTIKGVGIDEAITEKISEEIVGVNKEKVNDICGNVYKIYRTIFNEKDFINDYLLGTNTVEDSIEKEYGMEVLGLYQTASFFLDAYAIAETNLMHLNQNDPNYEKNNVMINRIMETSAKELSTLLKQMADKCLKIKVEEQRKKGQEKVKQQEKKYLNSNNESKNNIVNFQNYKRTKSKVNNRMSNIDKDDDFER